MLCAGLAACGARYAAPAPSAAAAPEARARETPACRAARLAILADVERSRDSRRCARDDECATVANPGSFSREVVLVAHGADREALDARARRHVNDCGAFLRVDPLDAIDVVTAVCASGRCEARTTTLHITE